MTTSNRFSVKLIAAGFVASSVFAMTLPALAHAATYAYVNQTGDVSTVTANDWMTAIATAFQIDVHSGVMLLTNQNGGIVGTTINVAGN